MDRDQAAIERGRGFRLASMSAVQSHDWYVSLVAYDKYDNCNLLDGQETETV